MTEEDISDLKEMLGVDRDALLASPLAQLADICESLRTEGWSDEEAARAHQVARRKIIEYVDQNLFRVLQVVRQAISEGGELVKPPQA
jgi:hypothetical protein